MATPACAATALDVVSAWKDVLLAVALVLVVRGARPAAVRRTRVDWLALAFGAFVVLYALIPQCWLDGGATHHGVLYGAAPRLAAGRRRTSSAAGSR